MLYIKSYAGKTKTSIFYTSGFINLVFLWKVWLKKKPDNVLEIVFKIGSNVFNHKKTDRVLISLKLLCSPLELPRCQIVQLQYITKILLYCKDIHNNFYRRLKVYKFTVLTITWPSSLFGLFILAQIPKVETDRVMQKSGIWAEIYTL